MSPRRLDGPTRRGVGVQWAEIGSPFDVWLMEAEQWVYLPFNTRQELLESYPGWRTEYLAASAAKIDARRPVKRITETGPAQDRADSAHLRAIALWQSHRTATPQIERWFQGFE